MSDKPDFSCGNLRSFWPKFSYLSEGKPVDFEMDELVKLITTLLPGTPLRTETIKGPRRGHVVSRTSSELIRDLLTFDMHSSKNPIEVYHSRCPTDPIQCGHSLIRNTPILIKHPSAPSASYRALRFSRYHMRGSMELRKSRLQGFRTYTHVYDDFLRGFAQVHRLTPPGCSGIPSIDTAKSKI
jgi:hypothetical protein